MLDQLKKIRDSIPPCEPPVWASTGHAQTILGHLIPSRDLGGGGNSHLIELESPEERIHALHLEGKRPAVVYVFHGLGGDIDSGYMRRTAAIANQAGFSVFLANHRGCGQGAGLARGTYHSGRGDDLSRVIAYGKKLYPGHRHVAIGFSLSANALLLLASGARGETLPDAAIAVNAPIHLEHASYQLTRGLNRIYDVRFALDLKRYLKVNHPHIPNRMRIWDDLRRFDELYTAPMGGFESREHYYESCSALPHLKNIRVPTVLLSAMDDPFVDGSFYRSAVVSDQVVLHLEENGGHMGYLAKRGLGYYRWLDEAIARYLSIF